MGRKPIDIYDEERVTEISADIAWAIDAATFGNISWDEVPARLARAFPGSFTALQNLNFRESRLNFASFQNMDDAWIKSYVEHFAYANPWTAFWESAKSGTIAISEEVSPARAIAHTEFYNDWLAPLEVDASVGMKILGDDSEVIRALLHFPISLTGTYDRAAAEIMRRVQGNFVRSVHTSRMIRAEAEQGLATAALVERGKCAAFVVDAKRALREANQMAVDLFRAGRLVAVRNHRCLLRNRDLDARFERALAQLTDGRAAAESCISCRTGAGVWQIVLAPIPVPPASRTSLSPVRPQQLVLVLVVELTLEGQKRSDLSGLSQAFNLTPAEVKFCNRLILGESVSETAELLGISAETARGRLKTSCRRPGPRGRGN